MVIISTTYAKEFSEDNFWGKIKKVAAKAGGKVLYTALLLYYTLQVPTVSPWAKTTIVAALGYFIFPFDAIPDITPVVGYADDFGVLVLALGTVSMYIDKNVKTQARNKIKDIFGNKVDMDELFEVEKNI